MQTLAVDGVTGTATAAPAGGMDTSAAADPEASTGTVADQDGPTKTILATTQVAGVYIDSNAGNDSNSGSDRAPWKTLARLAAARLAPGQSINLRCGSTWRESVLLDGRQFSDGISIQGYGDCTSNMAVITGADSFSQGWTQSGQVWSRRVPANMTKVSRLFVDGIPLRVAQWPNYGGIGREYAIAAADSPTGRSQLKLNTADATTLRGRDLSGATVQVKSEPWLLEQRVVASAAASGLLTFTAATQYDMEAGNGFILQDKLWMLDAEGEFFHDVAAGMLYVWPSTPAARANMNAVSVEGTVRDHGLQLRNRASLGIRFIAFTKHRGDGLVLVDTPGAVVERIQADDNGGNGILLARSSAAATGPTGTLVRYSRFLRNGLAGIEGTQVAGLSIIGNTVADTGMSPHAGNSNYAIGIGPAGLSQSNAISRTAQVGIRFSGTGGSRVLNNLVEDSGQRFSDGAAIKTWNGPISARNTVDQRSTVEANLIVRAPGNMEGAVGGAAGWAAGIYLDDFTMGVAVRRNTIVAAGVGIKLHNASNNEVSLNRVALSTDSALFANMDRSEGDFMSNNTITGNQWMVAEGATGSFPGLPSYTTPKLISFWHGLKGRAALGGGGNAFTTNELVMPAGASSPTVTVRGAGELLTLTHQDWIKLNPGDRVGTRTPRFKSVNFLEGGNLVPNGEFVAGLTGWTVYIAPASPIGSIRSMAGSPCTGACTVFTAGSNLDNLLSPVLNVSAGAMYRLTLNSLFLGSSTLYRPSVRHPNAPYAGLMASTVSNSALSGFAGTSVAQESVFLASGTSPARISLAAVAGSSVAFGQVTMKQVLGYSVARTTDWVGYARSDISSSRSVNCSDFGWPAGCAATDLSGNPMSFPLALSANNAAILLRTDSVWRSQ